LVQGSAAQLNGERGAVIMDEDDLPFEGVELGFVVVAAHDSLTPSTFGP
jgi:hypothetical protein